MPNSNEVNQSHKSADNLVIRQQCPDDYSDILRVTFEAFLTLDYAGRRRIDEHYLIKLINNSPLIIPELCFVAEINGEIVGHILFTRSKFMRPDGTEAESITLGPLSVLPEFQKQGIGRALVFRSIEKAREMGFHVILLVGVPDYYPKLGFHRASGYGLKLADNTESDAFMVYELTPDYLNGGGIYHSWAPEFDIAENDDAGFELFHREFMFKYFPGELRLRCVFENDMLVIRRWLNAVPNKPLWVNHINSREDLLRDLQARYEECNFMTNMIAEVDGKPIGFCRYYDCHDALKHGSLSIDLDSDLSSDLSEINISIPGCIYAIEYFIGEADYISGYRDVMIKKIIERIKALGAKAIVIRPNNA